MSLVDLLRARAGAGSGVKSERAIWGLNEYPYAMLAGLGYTTANAGGVEQALSNAATWACIDVLADAVSRTPVDAVRVVGDVRVPVTPTPALVGSPSGLVAPDVWRYQLAWSVLTDGNAFGRIVAYDRAGYPTQVELLDPADVTVREVRGAQAQVRVGGEVRGIWPNGDIWHVPGRMVRPGSPFGVSPVKYAAKTTGTSLSAEDFSNRFFTDSGHPTYKAVSDQPLTQEQANGVKAAIQRTMRDRAPLVVGSGIDVQPMQLPPNQTQFLELLEFCVLQACRFWRVPPSMVFASVSGQNVTYANVTQADLHFLKHSLDGYFVRIETALTAALPDPLIARANRNAMLRADVEARYKAYEIALKNGFTSVNEVRALEDLPPFGPDQDRPGVPDPARQRDLAETIQKVYLGVGKVLTADEAREIVNKAGADLSVPGPLPEYGVESSGTV